MTGRVIGLDLARLLALLGMFVAHVIPAFGPGPGGVDLLFQVVAGRSAALFAVLAGVSIALVTRNIGAADGPGRAALRTRVLIRTGVITGIGLVLGLLDSGVAVILVYYGLLFLLALPVLTWRARGLALLALGWGLATPVLSLWLRPHLPDTTYQVPSPVSLADPLQLLSELLVTGYYPVLTWGTYLFAGMALGRLDLRRPRIGPWLALTGAWLAALALAVSRLVLRTDGVPELLAGSAGQVAGWTGSPADLRRGFYGTHPADTAWWLGVWVPHSGSIVDLAHTVGCSMLVIGICLTLVGWTGRWPWRVIAGAGAMTLTLYSLHVVLLSAGLQILWVHAVIALTIGSGVALLARRGPLEALVRRVSRPRSAERE